MIDTLGPTTPMRERVRSAGTIALAMVTLLLTLHVGVAVAHPDGYCGHQSHGAWWVTELAIGGHARRSDLHRHTYNHYDWGGWRFRHRETRWCHVRDH